MVEVNQQQTCKKCGREQRFEYSVLDSLWIMLPKKWHNRCLCIECFIEEIDKMLIDEVNFSKNEFKFLAIVGDKLHCIIKDKA